MSSVPDTPSPAQDFDARIAAIVAPPAFCPGCLVDAGQSFPDQATTRYCARHIAEMRATWRKEEQR